MHPPRILRSGTAAYLALLHGCLTKSREGRRVGEVDVVAASSTTATVAATAPAVTAFAASTLAATSTTAATAATATATTSGLREALLDLEVLLLLLLASVTLGGGFL